MKFQVAVIGSGIAGLAAAAYAAKAGNAVSVFEKNSSAGGRARQFTTDNGYSFDMGPSWYWMPDIIDNFFADFGLTRSDYFALVSLDPQFEMVFPDSKLAIPKDYWQLRSLFESVEKGAGKQLDAFMKSACEKYEISMDQLVYTPCHSWREFLSPAIAKKFFRLDLFSNFRSYVRKYFSDPRLIALMEFPVIFLGGAPKDIPALYSLMHYGGYVMGTKYPMGGFYELVKAMKAVGEQYGVQYFYNSSIEKINVADETITSLTISGKQYTFDAVISAADYQHTESLLDKPYRNYTSQYWENRIFAPSCLIYYLGINERLPQLKHHTLFFEEDLNNHLDAIYKTKSWPDKPLFYVCCPSQTDPSVAPPGHENLFLLMPLPIGVNDEEAIREQYLDIMLTTLEKHAGVQNLKDKIDYKKSYCVSNFENDYNAFRGNAYGLANTFAQTAVWKPSIRNRKVSNLYYTGQLTVPGPGVPPSIISGKIAATELNKYKAKVYEKAF